MTELIWDGKYKDGKKQGPVRIALPFQTVETVNESAQDRQRSLELFSAHRELEWRNRLIWGDKKYVLPSLLPEFAGKVQLIYIDPPFDTGTDFSFVTAVPGSDERFTKEPSILEQKAYRDTWGVTPDERERGVSSTDKYLRWFFDSALLLRDLLAEDGTIYVHLDWHVGPYVKVLLDEVFGLDNYLSELTWQRTSAHGDTKFFGNVADKIYAFAKNQAMYEWNQTYVPFNPEYVSSEYRYQDPDGRRFRRGDLTGAGTTKGATGQPWRGLNPRDVGRHWARPPADLDTLDKLGKIYWPPQGKWPHLKVYLDESRGAPVTNLWTDIPPLNNVAKEGTGYATQKPESLLERIIRASSNEGDLVLDCFGGSGTTAAVAEKLNRRWITCDLSRFAIHTARKRLLGVSNVRPFAVQNLGKYERQAWQVAEFPANGKNHLEEQSQRESSYRRFILDLYHAQPITSHAWLHGTKSGRMVHVAAVDAPVTQSDVKAIARDAWKALGMGKGTSTEDRPITGATKAGVDILGWEFALDLNETAKYAVAASHVDVAFKKIPREVLDKKAVEQGDVKFFELGALSVDVKQKKRSVTLKLTDFVIPTDDIPEEARKAIKHWSQLVDYWAVDWDFKSDTFHNQWQSYRTRKDPKIELATSYEYKEPGKYQIVVKVIDILGNDTTKTIQLEV